MTTEPEVKTFSKEEVEKELRELIKNNPEFDSYCQDLLSSHLCLSPLTVEQLQAKLKNLLKDSAYDSI